MSHTNTDVMSKKKHTSMPEVSSKDATKLIGGDNASFFPELTLNFALSCDLCLGLRFSDSLLVSRFGFTGDCAVVIAFGKALEEVVTVNTLLMSLVFEGDSDRSFVERGDNGSGVLFGIRPGVLGVGFVGKLKF